MEQIKGMVSLSGSLSLQVNEVKTSNYNELDNLPSINGTLVKGELTTEDLKIRSGYDAQIDPDDPEHLILKL